MPLDPYTLSDAILAHVLGALDACDRPKVNRAMVAAGVIAWDDCCGQLAVAPERVFRSSEFPLEDTDEERCEPPWIAVELLVLLVRCVPGVDDRGRAPAASKLSAAYASILRDAAVVWKAVGVDALPDTEWDRAAVSQTFAGDQGQCVGIETRLTVGVPAVEWCDICPPPDPPVEDEDD